MKPKPKALTIVVHLAYQPDGKVDETRVHDLSRLERYRSALARYIDGFDQKKQPAGFIEAVYVKRGPYFVLSSTTVGLNDTASRLPRFHAALERASKELERRLGVADETPVQPPRKAPRSAKPVAARVSLPSLLATIRRRKPPAPCRPGFELGTVHLSHTIAENIPREALEHDAQRFLSCDWGDVDRDTTLKNNRSTRERKGPVFGVYHYRGQEYWIITDLTARKTLVALPEET